MCVLLVAADVLVTGRLGWLFDIGFVALCIGVALAVHPSGFFRVGVMPPFLLLGISLLLAVVDRQAVALANDTFVQAVVSGLAHHSGALFAGVVITLVVLAIRHRVTHVRRDRAEREASSYSYANLETSPPPTPGHLGRAGGEVDDRGRLRRRLAAVEHRVEQLIQLLLDRPALGHRVVLPGQDQRLGEQRLVELGEQRGDHAMVGDPHADGALLRMQEPSSAPPASPAG